MTILQLVNIITRNMQLIVKVLDTEGNIGNFVFMSHELIKKKCKEHDYEVVSIRRGTEIEKAEYGSFATFVEVVETGIKTEVVERPLLIDILKAFDPSINVQLATSNSEIYTKNYPGPLLNYIEGDERVGCLKTRASNGYFVRTTMTKTQFAALQAKKVKEAKKALEENEIIEVVNEDNTAPNTVVEAIETDNTASDNVSADTNTNEKEMVSVEQYEQKGVNLYNRYRTLSEDLKGLIKVAFSQDNGIYNLNMLFSSCLSGAITSIDFCKILDIDNSEFYNYLYRFMKLRGKVCEPTNTELLVTAPKKPVEPELKVEEPIKPVRHVPKYSNVERKNKFDEIAKLYVAGNITYDAALDQSGYTASTFYKKIGAYRKVHNIITAAQTVTKAAPKTTTEKKEAAPMPAPTTVIKVDIPAADSTKPEAKVIAAPPAKQPKAPNKPNAPKPNKVTSTGKTVITNNVLFGKCSDFVSCINSINNIINMYLGVIPDKDIIYLMRKHSMVGDVYANIAEKAGKLVVLSSGEISRTCCLDLGTMFLNGTASFDQSTRQYAMNGVAELVAMNMSEINVHVDEKRKMTIRMKSDPDPAKTPDKDTEERNMIMEFVMTRCRSMEGAAVTDKEAYTKYQQFCDGKQYASKLIKLKDFIVVFSDTATAVCKDVRHTNISDYGKGNTGYENMIILR